MIRTKNVSSVSDRIYGTIKNEIFSCVFSPGDVMTIDSLASRFEVSRTPVREALLALCKEGLLLVRPRVGFCVTPVDVREIIETYSLRILLEKEAVRLAVTRISSETLLQLGRIMELPVHQYNHQFHSLIAKESGWGVLADVLETLLDKSARTRACLLHAEKHYARESLKGNYGHRDIYDALLRRDEEKAVAAMERHLEEAKNRVLKAISIV